MKKQLSVVKSRQFLRVAGLFILVLLIIGAFLYYVFTVNRVFIDDSLIQAPIITITPTTSGRVQEMDVAEGQYVQKGDTLAVVGSETIRANTDGLIINAPDQTGASVTPATPLIQMVRAVDLRVAGTIDEDKGLDQIKVGQVVSFSVDAFPGKTYWGYVDEVAPTAKTAQISFSISSERPTQQFLVYAHYDTTEYPELRNGMSAKIVVFTKSY
jgi:multidrug resistance efflux pump